MKHNNSFAHTQVGFITILTEPVHGETTMEYAKKIFSENENLTAIPIEGDRGVVGILEKEELMKHHGVIENLLYNKVIDYIDKDPIIIDAWEHVENALPELIRSSDEMIENCMVYHLGRFYGVLNIRILIDHIFTLRNDSLERAREIQNHFTGKNVFEHGFFSAEVYLEQAHALGGDFFQMSRLSETESVVACFDVSGKDIQASLMTGLITGYFATVKAKIIEAEFDKIDFVQTLHTVLKDRTPEDIFVAGVMIFYSSDDNTLTLFNMGYSPLYIVSKVENKRKIKLRNPALPPLGFPSMTCDEKTVITLPAEPNLLILGFSDGLTDANDKHGKQFGDEKVTELVQKSLSNGETNIASQLLESVKNFIGKSPRSDDITIFQVRING